MKDINPDNIKKLAELIDKAGKIGIVAHIKPDGDALGSTSALWYFLRKIGKEDVRLFLPHICQRSQEFLIDSHLRSHLVIGETNPQEAQNQILDCDLLVCCDFPDFSRAGEFEHALRSSEAKKIQIDHHLNPDRDAFDLSFSETEVSSASELEYFILVNLVQYKNCGHLADNNGDYGKATSKIPSRALKSLMCGMTTDTNNFANSVKPGTLLMASELLRAGVNRDAILHKLYNCFSEKRTRLLGYMLKDLMTITPDGVAYIILDKKTQLKYRVREGDTEGFVNKPLEIAKVRMSILVKQDTKNENELRISIRSKTGTSANRCSGLYFNGGGHEQAAGGKILIGKEIAGIAELPDYIERNTHSFFNGNNE